jgi:hypothetical protein
MKTKKITGLSILFVMYGCTNRFIPVTKSDHVLADSKLLKSLAAQTDGEFSVNVITLNKSNQQVADVRGLILGPNNTPILDGNFHFNQFSYTGWTNPLLGGSPFYTYSEHDDPNVHNMISDFGSECSFKLNNGNDLFKTSFYVPLPITLGNKTSALSSNQVITWNADPNNALGVIILIYDRYYITADDGSVNLRDIIAGVPDTISAIDITFYRRNGIVVDGSDNRKYKVLSTCETHLYTHIR